MSSWADPVEWDKTLELLFEIWPDWTPGEQFKEMFERRFRSRNQEWVREAITEVSFTYSSREPRPAWFEKMWQEILNRNRATPSASNTAEEKQKLEEDREKEILEEQRFMRERIRNAPRDELLGARDRFLDTNGFALICGLRKYAVVDDPTQWSIWMIGGLYVFIEQEMPDLFQPETQG